MIEQLFFFSIGFIVGIMIPIRRFASYSKSYHRHTEKEHQNNAKEQKRGQIIKLKSDLEKDIEEITKT